MANTVKVQVKNVYSSPQKARLVADLVRGMTADKAIAALTFLNKKPALFIKKAIESGVANAKDVLKITDASALVISKLTIDEGIKRRWHRFASRGRVSMLTKRKAHINLELKAK
jgi:large subunit ribosomal protein L22